MTLFDLLARQRRVIYLGVALLGAAGVWSALRLPSAIYPELAFPRIVIIVQGSSLGPRQQVFSITRPIEEAVSLVPGVERVVSRSIRGASEISIWFSPRSDMTIGLQLVQARVNEVQSQLPANLEIQVERLMASVFPILTYNLEGGDAATLFDLARYQVRPVLSRIRGVGRVDIQAPMSARSRSSPTRAASPRTDSRTTTWPRRSGRRSRRRPWGGWAATTSSTCW